MTAELTPNSNVPILAIDLGKFNSMCCFFDPQTLQARFQTVPTDRGYLRSFLSAQKVGLVVLEVREFRALVKHRKSLDQRINRLKNSIRSRFVI